MRCKSHSIALLNSLTVIGPGGAPATHRADLPGLRAAAGQRDGLDVLVEVGRLGQAHHGEAVEGRAVRAVNDHLGHGDVLLGSLLHRHIVDSQGRDGPVGSGMRGGDL